MSIPEYDCALTRNGKSGNVVSGSPGARATPFLDESHVSISECELTCNGRSGNVVFGTSGARACRGARACGGARVRVRYEILICTCGSPYIHKAGP